MLPERRKRRMSSPAPAKAWEGALYRLKGLTQIELQLLLAAIANIQQRYRDGDHILHLVSVTPVKKGQLCPGYDVVIFVAIYGGEDDEVVFIKLETAEDLQQHFDRLEPIRGRRGVAWLIRDSEDRWSFSPTDPKKKRVRRR